MGENTLSKLAYEDRTTWYMEGANYRTRSLFIEHCHDEENLKYVKFTLKDSEYRGFPSLKQLYLSCKDPTEYSFATKYLGGWKHWLALQKSPLVRPHIEEWREELELLMRSEAFARLKSELENPQSQASFTAARTILQKYGDLASAQNKVVGRPSKERIKKEAEHLFRNTDLLYEDAERLDILLKN
jgi:hypothetical protein